MTAIGNDWDAVLVDVFASAQFKQLQSFLDEAYATCTIYPHKDDIFNAFQYTPLSDVKVVIIGQDPYHQPNQAHGLSFSVMPGTPIPPSLRNMYKELFTDLQITPPIHGCLTAWAKRGILLLNAVLTVEAGKPRSHVNKGWEFFTDEVLKVLNQQPSPIVFLLWGNDAHKKGEVINASHHLLLKAAHPSPLARGKFFGCRHFSKANQFLQARGVDWSL